MPFICVGGHYFIYSVLSVISCWLSNHVKCSLLSVCSHMVWNVDRSYQLNLSVKIMALCICLCGQDVRQTKFRYSFNIQYITGHLFMWRFTKCRIKPYISNYCLLNSKRHRSNSSSK